MISFSDTLILSIYNLILNARTFQDDVTDVSAPAKALLNTDFVSNEQHGDRQGNKTRLQCRDSTQEKRPDEHFSSQIGKCQILKSHI